MVSKQDSRDLFGYAPSLVAKRAPLRRTIATGDADDEGPVANPAHDLLGQQALVTFSAASQRLVPNGFQRHGIRTAAGRERREILNRRAQRYGFDAEVERQRPVLPDKITGRIIPGLRSCYRCPGNGSAQYSAGRRPVEPRTAFGGLTDKWQASYGK